MAVYTPSIITVPTILFQEFNTKDISNWIPMKVVQNSQQLAALAYNLFLGDSHIWSIHFHLTKSGEYEGKISTHL